MPAIRHFLQFSDFTADEHDWIFQRAAAIKKKCPYSGIAF